MRADSHMGYILAKHTNKNSKSGTAYRLFAMPHYLTPMSSVTTVTTCRMEGRSPRRPRPGIDPDECSCGTRSTDTSDTDGSSTSRESIASDPPSPAETETEGVVKMETASSVDQFIDAVGCSGQDETSDEFSVRYEMMEISPTKAEVLDEASGASVARGVSPMTTDLSSDVSAVFEGSPSPVKSEGLDTSSTSEESDNSPLTSESSNDSVPSAHPAPLSPERLQAAAEVIGRCGQLSAGRQAVQQPRDFSRERPTGVRHIRRAVKRSRRRKSANPKRLRRDSSDIAR